MKTKCTLLYLLMMNCLIAFSQDYSFSANSLPVANGWAPPCTLDIVVSGLPAGGILTAGILELKQVNISIGDGIANQSLNKYSVELISPDGLSKIIVIDNGNGSASSVTLIDARFRDNTQLGLLSAAQSAGAPYRVGYYKTLQPFSNVLGTNANGTWKVVVKRTSGVTKKIGKIDLIFGSPFDVTNLSSTTSYDNCANAQCIDQDHIFIGTNSGFTMENSDPFGGSGVASDYPGGCQWNGAKNNSAWYTFIANSTTSTVSISGLTNNIQMIGLKGPACQLTDAGWLPLLIDGGCPIDVANDDYDSHRYTSTSGTSYNQQLKLSNLIVGQRYYIIIDGNGGSVSPYYIELTNGKSCCPLELNVISTDPACFGGTGLATATVSGQLAPIGNEYQFWLDNLGDTIHKSTGITPNTISGLTTGNYFITAIDPDFPSCKIKKNFTILSPPASIIVSAGMNDTICNGESAMLSAVASNGTTPYHFEWDNSSTINNDTLSSPTANPNATTTYTVTATDAGGCTTSSSVKVVVNPIPTPIITKNWDNNLCTACNGSLTASPSGLGVSYIWSDPAIQTAANAINLCGGNYTVTVTQNGCSATATSTISDPIPPTIALTATPASCGRTNGIITSTITGGIAPFHYQWQHSTLDTASFSDLAGGTYSVTITDNGGCTASTSVVVNSTPDITIQVSTLPDTCSRSVGSATVTSPATASSYLWSTTPSQNTNTAVNLGFGSYIVTVTDNGCTGTYTAIISNIGGPSIGSINQISANCNLADGSATVNPIGGSGAYNYIWDDPLSQTTQTATALSPGNYHVTVSDAGSCVAIGNITVTNNSGPSVTITPTSSHCNQAIGSLKANPSGGTNSYSYLWDDASTQSTQTAINLSPGTYNVTVTDINTSCTVSEIGTVGNISGPDATVTASTITVLPGSDITFTSNTTGVSNYQWDFGDGSTGSGAQITHTFENIGNWTIQLLVTDSYNCIDTTSIIITVVTIRIPNVFTPDGDGINDTFVIEGIEYFQTRNLKIYNRWGRVIYQTDSYNNDWDGGNHPSGVYYYIIIPQENKSFHGSVTIFK